MLRVLRDSKSHRSAKSGISKIGTILIKTLTSSNSGWLDSITVTEVVTFCRTLKQNVTALLKFALLLVSQFQVIESEVLINK